MKNSLKGLFVLTAIIGIFSCNKGIDYEKLRKEELATLNEFIDNNYGTDAEPTATGLYYFNESGTGSGDTIKLGDQVSIFYATWALTSANDSLLVDESIGYLDGYRYEPLTFTVGASEVVSGLDEAMQYMQAGTRSHLVINSELAYGQSGSSSGGIGMFQTILMEVEVYKVVPYE